MVERAAVARFLDAYRAAFEAFDAHAIADLFSYPCQITGDAGEVTVTAVSSHEEWVRQIERLLEAYREIDVHTADVLELHLTELTSLLVQATVRWTLADADGRSVYDFTASYTLADRGGGLRTTAIAHNEMPRLRAALEDRRRG